MVKYWKYLKKQKNKQNKNKIAMFFFLGRSKQVKMKYLENVFKMV